MGWVLGVPVGTVPSTGLACRPGAGSGPAPWLPQQPGPWRERVSMGSWGGGRWVPTGASWGSGRLHRGGDGRDLPKRSWQRLLESESGRALGGTVFSGGLDRWAV